MSGGKFSSAMFNPVAPINALMRRLDPFLVKFPSDSGVSEDFSLLVAFLLVTFSWLFRGFFVALFCLETQCSGLFCGFFVVFSWLFLAPILGKFYTYSPWNSLLPGRESQTSQGITKKRDEGKGLDFWFKPFRGDRVKRDREIERERQRQRQTERERERERQRQRQRQRQRDREREREELSLLGWPQKKIWEDYGLQGQNHMLIHNGTQCDRIITANKHYDNTQGHLGNSIRWTLLTRVFDSFAVWPCQRLISLLRSTTASEKIAPWKSEHDF